MGCAPCNSLTIIPLIPHSSLRHRFRQPLQTVSKHPTVMLSLEEMQCASMQEEINYDEIMAGEGYYLSKERRALWKVAVSYNTLLPSAHPLHTHAYTFSPNPQATPATKQRFEQIRLDVHRTFPDCTNLNRSELSLTLQNITLYFPVVGYTQGMNFLVGFLLLCGFTPEESFWLFIRLSYDGRYILIRNFTEGFRNVTTAVKMLEKRIARDSPLAQSVQSMGLNAYFYSFQWFITYFLYSLDLRSCVLLWDHILVGPGPCSQDGESPGPIGSGLMGIIAAAVGLFNLIGKKSQEETTQNMVKRLRSDSLQMEITPGDIRGIISNAEDISWEDFLAETDGEMTAISTTYLAEWKKNKYGTQNPNQEAQSQCLAFYAGCILPKR